MSEASKTPPVTIFYDGACPLCSREINHYRRHPRGQAFGYVDIASPQFDAGAHRLDKKAVNRSLHIKTRDGRVLDGVDAFSVIWQELGGFYVYLASMTKLPVSRQLMLVGYRIFATVRPRLPGRKACPAPSHR